MVNGRCSRSTFELLVLAKIKINTRIRNTNFINVFSKFDKTLFLKLAPPFPKVTIIQFDGCLKGDHVKIKLHFPFFTQIWESEIIENGSDSISIWFVDQGIKLPFFISKWKHFHQIKQNNSDVIITDEIEFESHNWFLTALFYPIIYLQFLYRIPIYKRL
jgi:ligand-binding SRPBCC domain-containing protein